MSKRSNSEPKQSFWNTVEEGSETWVSWLSDPERPGESWITLKVLDWEPKTWEYQGRDWKPRLYLETNMGKLAISSKRLQKTLLNYAKEKYEGYIRITRIGSGLNTHYIVKKIIKFDEV